MRSLVVGGLLRTAWIGLVLAAKPVFGRPPTTIFSFSGTPAPISQVADADADGLPDSWETRHNLDPLDPTDATCDIDGDGQSARAEFLAGTDPWQMDSNRDGLQDGLHDALTTDTNHDGLPDAWAFTWLAQPNLDASADPDGDGIPLLAEWQQALHPTAPDVADIHNTTRLFVYHPAP